MARIKAPSFIALDHRDFWTFIESGVTDLVRALLNLGFTTVASCQGHKGDPEYGDAFVRLGFKKDEDSLELKKKLICLLLDAQREEDVKFSINFFGKPVTMEDEEEFDDYSVTIVFPTKHGTKNISNLVTFLQKKIEEVNQ